MRVRSMKTFCTLVGVILLASFLVVALEVGIVWAAEGKVTISLASERPDPDYSTLVEMCKKFEQENPNIEVETRHVPYEGFEDKLIAQIMAGNPPDVPVLLERWVRRFAAVPEALLDLTPYLPQDYGKKFEQLSWKNGVYQGKVVALPNGIYVCAYMYNKDMFDEVGLVAPKTLKENWTYTKELYEATQKLQQVSQWGFQFWMRSIPSRLNHVYAFGGSILTEDLTAPNLDHPKTVAALKWMEKMFREGIAPPSNFSEAAGAARGEDVFLAGKVPFIPMAGQPHIRRRLNEGIEFAFDMMLCPQEEQTTGAQGPHYLAVSQRSKHTEEATQLVKFLMRKDINGEFCGKTLYTPALLEARSLAAELYMPFAQPMMSVFDIQAGLMPDQCFNEQQLPAWSEIDGRLRGEIELMALGQKTAEQVIKDGSAMIRDVLEKYE